ncbi:hypothetical protein [Acidithiobacillus marinus]|uniref:hypothetical protein n=1 Tax=Acidithiobacillus marinus TaxID=187490 RepID=UPI001179F50A|nr:hypothetical protein [Acidithiobacillus marinus]
MSKNLQHPRQSTGAADKTRPTLMDVLNVLESRLDIVEQQCTDVLESIDHRTRAEIDDQITIMDAEINRCQKFLQIIKASLNPPDKQ